MSEPEGRGAPEASGEYSMSGQAPAGERPGGGQTSVRDCLHAEWTKVRTAPGTIWLLAAAMVLTVGVSTGAVAATRCPPGAGCPVDVTKLSLTGVQVGQALVAILAVLMVSAEYGTGMIRTTLTAIPRPSAVLAAKAAILTGLVLAAGTAGVAGSVLAGRLILPGPWAGLGGRAGRLGRRGAAARRRGPQQARRMSEPEGLKGAPEASGKHSMTGTPP